MRSPLQHLSKVLSRLLQELADVIPAVGHFLLCASARSQGNCKNSTKACGQMGPKA